MVCKIGSILEIETSKGFAYMQYTHKHNVYGYLIRVMEGLYPTPQTDLDLLNNSNTLFCTFIHVGAALRQKSLKKIGFREAPLQFPLFRKGYPDPETRKIPSWKIWDGEKYLQKEELTEEEKHYPPLHIDSVDTLKTSIEAQWRPIHDFDNPVL